MEGGVDVQGAEELGLEIVIQQLSAGQLQGGAEDAHTEITVCPAVGTVWLTITPGGGAAEEACQPVQPTGHLQVLQGGAVGHEGAGRGLPEGIGVLNAFSPVAAERGVQIQKSILGELHGGYSLNYFADGGDAHRSIGGHGALILHGPAPRAALCHFAVLHHGHGEGGGGVVFHDLLDGLVHIFLGQPGSRRESLR